MDDARHDLYNNLKDSGIGEDVIGTEKDFTDFLQDDASASDLYDNLKDSGIGEDIIGTKKDFCGFLAEDFKPKPQEQNQAQAAPEDNEESTQNNTGEIAQQVINNADKINTSTQAVKQQPKGQPKEIRGVISVDLPSAEIAVDAYGNTLKVPRDEVAKSKEEQFLIANSQLPNTKETLKLATLKSPSGQTQMIPVSDFFDKDYIKEKYQGWRVKSELKAGNGEDYYAEIDDLYDRDGKLKVPEGTNMAEIMRTKEIYDKMYEERLNASDEALADNRQEYGKLYSKEADKYVKRDEQDRGFWGNLLKAFAEGSRPYATAMNNPYEQFNRTEEGAALSTALAKTDEAAKVINTMRKTKRSKGFWDMQQNFKNVVHGVYNAVSDVGFYDGGLKKANEEVELTKIVTKESEGKPITEFEKLAINAAAINYAINKAYSQEIAHGVTAGKTIAEMVPFMAQMAMNPANGLGQAAVKQAIKRYGVSGFKALMARAAARVAGDLGASVVLANTLQVGNTMANALERYNKAHDVLGNEIGYGRANGISIWEALGKAEGSAVIENFTEMLGGYHGTILDGVKKAGNKFLATVSNKVVPIAKKYNVDKAVINAMHYTGLPQIFDAVNKVRGSYATKVFNEALRKANYHGSLGEMLEEEYGIVLNSLVTGDNQLSDLFDRKQQIDIALGVGLFGGVVSSVQAAHYPIAKYRVDKQLTRADQAGQMAYGESWTQMREDIDAMSNEQISDYIDTQLDETTDQTKRAALINYANAKVKHNSFNLEGEDRLTNSIAPEAQASQEQAEEEGANATNEEKFALEQRLEQAKENLIGEDKNKGEAFLEEVEQWLDDPVNGLVQLSERGYSDEDLQKAKEYYNAYGAVNASNEVLSTDIEDQINAANDEAKRNAGLDGNITPIIYRGEANSYLASGNVVFNEDGTINRAESDELVWVRDSNGELQQALITNIESNGEIVSLEQQMQDNETRIREEMQTAHENAKKRNPSVTAPVVGLPFSQNGQQYIIKQIYDDKITCHLIVDGKETDTTYTTSFDDYYNSQNAELTNKQQIDDKLASEFTRDDKVVRLSDTNYRYIGERDGQVYLQEINDNGTIVGTLNISKENYDKGFQGEVENTFAPEVAQTEQANEQAPEVTTEQQTEQAPEVKTPAIERIPKDDKGNYLYEQAETPDVAWDAIVEQAEGSEEVASAVVADMVKDKQAEVKAAEKAKAKSGKTIVEKIAAEKERLNSINKAREELAIWQEIASTLDRRKKQESNKEIPTAEVKQEEQETKEQTPVAEVAPVAEEKTQEKEEPKQEEQAEEEQEQAPKETQEQSEEQAEEQEPEGTQEEKEKPTEEGVLTKIVKALGLQLVYEDIANPNMNGYIKDGIVHINKNSKNAMSWVAGHELTHHIRKFSNHAYEVFAKKVETMAKEIGINLDARKAKTKKNYIDFFTKKYIEFGLSEAEAKARANADITDDYIREEIICDIAGDLLSTNSERIIQDILTEFKPSFFGNIKNAVVNFFDRLKAFIAGNKARYDAINNAIQAWEQAYIEVQGLTNIPDMTEDKPSDARARGFRRDNGHKIVRQRNITNIQGKSVDIKFANDKMVNGHVAIIDADDLQPSHINRQRNALHFIDEAQPKERNDQASIESARRMAREMRPEEVTTSVTAYTGAPTINKNGEVIQGNNRSEALKLMWGEHDDKAAEYKQYLIEHASQFGLTEEEVMSMKHPVLVNMLDVNDDDAITLGQYVAQDTESGGLERLNPKNIFQKMRDDIKTFANLLLETSDDELTFSQLIDTNGLAVLKWLGQKGFITPTQYQSSVDAKGNLTAEAKNDLKQILYHSIFNGANTRLEGMFNRLPIKAQRAILATAFRDYISPESESMISEIQNSIIAYSNLLSFEQFANAKTKDQILKAVEAWKKQYVFDDSGEGTYLPSDKFSNFAILLAQLYKSQTQSFVQSVFNDMFDMIQGTREPSLFDEEKPRKDSLREAIKKVLNIDYNGKNGSDVLDINTKTSEQQQRGSERDASSREQNEKGSKSTNNSRGAKNVGGKGNLEDSSTDKRYKFDDTKLTNDEGVLIDENGEPIVFYQGTDADITSVSGLEAGHRRVDGEKANFNGDGISFTPDINVAQEYGTNLIAANITLKKPYVTYGVAGLNEEQAKKLKEDLIAKGYDGIISFPSVSMKKIGAPIMEVVVFDNSSLTDAKPNLDDINGRESSTSNKGYTIEPSEYTTKRGKVLDLQLVKFDKVLTKKEFDSAKALAKSLKGWYDSKKGGFMMRSENDAQTLIDAVMEESGEKLKDAEPISLSDIKKETDKNKQGSIEDIVQAIIDDKDYQDLVIDNPDKEAVDRAMNSIIGRIVRQKRGEHRELYKKFSKDDASKAELLSQIKKMVSDKQKSQKPTPKEENKFNDKTVVIEKPETWVNHLFFHDGQYLICTSVGNGRVSFDNKKMLMGEEYDVSFFQDLLKKGNVVPINVSKTYGKNKNWDAMIDGWGYTPNTKKASDAPKTDTANAPKDDVHKLVTTARYEELAKRMREKLNNLNIGIDPEILSIGVEMAVFHIEGGARKFAKYAKNMISDIGDEIRPYLKSFYNGARDLPEVIDSGLSSEMDTYELVEKFDVFNFDKTNTDPLSIIENIANEATIDEQADKAKKKIIEERNEERKKENNDSNSLPLPNDDVKRKFAKSVANEMLDALEKGIKPYRSILDIRKKAALEGIEVDKDGRTDIMLQELVEDGLIRAAKHIVAKHGRDTKECFDKICELYELQPTISARSSNRIEMQQYSTPLPMSFVADLFAMHGKHDGIVFEPTAGNGMMVFAVPSSQVHVNELDKNRLFNLREQGFASVTEQDAKEPFEGNMSYDAIIANPPFGYAKAKSYEGKEINGLDPQITLNALSKMKDNGRAAIIIGGNMEYAVNGSIKDQNWKRFFTYLYDHYNVKGVVDMSGKMYARQGTTYPTRMILIDGRRSEEEREQTSIYPPIASKAIEKVESFEELYERVNEITNNNNKTNGTEVLRSGNGVAVPNPVKDGGNSNGGLNNRQHNENVNDSTVRPRGGRRTRPKESQGSGGSVLLGQPRQNNGTSSVEGTTDRHNSGAGPKLVQEPTVRGLEDGGVRHGVLGLEEEETKQTKKRNLTEEKLPYRPHNTNSFRFGSVSPAAIAEAMDNILTKIEGEYGDIDSFVTKELDYDSIEELHNALAAEQVDSVAMAIYQMKQGQALIIGDQTGVGKGRQIAALIRWSVKQGKKPIFITQNANLFSGMYSDLVDIGSGELVPFIFNDRNGKNKGEMTDANGKVIFQGYPKEKFEEVFKTGELPDECDYAVLSYSQIASGDSQSELKRKAEAKKSGKRTKSNKKNDEKPKNTDKATLLRSIAKDNYLLLDESHTAAGDSNVGAFIQSILKDARGVIFASATFAKRPDSMPLYAVKTAISKANIETRKLIGIIEKGGVTLQEIMSRALSKAGQMVRRERDMSDVKTDWITISDSKTVKKAQDNYDKTIEAFNAIIKFQNDFVKPYIDNINAEIAIIQSTASVKQGTDDLGVDNTPFANKSFNYTKQLMLALKIDAVVDEVEKQIKEGRHPVIALESTMETSIKADYKVGDVIPEPTFSASLLRGLDTVMQYSQKDSDGKKEVHTIMPSDISTEAEEAYDKLVSLIKKNTSEIFISPLDAIIGKLNAKGYKVGELTGRELSVTENDNGEFVVSRRKDRDNKKLQREFNSGILDVLILNKSASTGINLHASEKFSDQRQRTMIVVQPLSDINDYMQMMGRIDRTGQVHRGYYINLGLPIPAENRFLMMLSTKLKSLNANTTTTQESENNEVKAPDLLNKYGSQVIVEYLKDNLDVYEKIGKPLKAGKAGKVSAYLLEDYVAQAEDARTITGRIALLSTKEQTEFYDDVIRRYNELINYLNEIGSNDLKINAMPLRAKTLSKLISSNGTDNSNDNPFAQNSYVERVEMDVLRKPMTAKDVKKTIEQINNGLEGKERIEQIISTIDSETKAKIDLDEQKRAKAKEDSKENVEKQVQKILNNEKLSDKDKQTEVENYKAQIESSIDTRFDNAIKKIKAKAGDLKGRLGVFVVGKTYLVPTDLNSSVFEFSSPAIFCGYKSRPKNLTLSTTLAVFATLDGRRRIEVKLNQSGPLSSITNHTNQNYEATLNTDLNNWDSQIPKETRKEGYILTGNILQAIEDTRDENGNFRGQLISYTDIDGEVHDGILMPDKWTVSNLNKKGTPIIAKLNQIKNFESFTSSDNFVELTGDSYSKIMHLTVPKTSKNGGKYFKDDVIKESAIKHWFYPYRGGKLRADIPAGKITTVVNRLNELGVTINDDSPLQEFRDTRFSLQGEESEMEKPDYVTSIGNRLGVAIRIDDNSKAKSYYDDETQSIVINSGKAKTKQDIAKVAIMSTAKTKGLQSVLGSLYNSFLDNVYSALDDNAKKSIDANGNDIRQATVDYMKTLCESGATELSERNNLAAISVLLNNTLNNVSKLKREPKYNRAETMDLILNGWNGNSIDAYIENTAKANAIRANEEKADILTDVMNEAAMKNALDVRYSLNKQVEEDLSNEARQAYESSVYTNTVFDTLKKLGKAVFTKNGAKELKDTFLYRMNEAFANQMLSVDELMKAISKQIDRPLKDSENITTALIQASSAASAQMEAYNLNYFQPIIKAVQRLVAHGMTREDVEHYLYCKSGIERSREMAIREWRNHEIRLLDKEKEDYEEELENINNIYDDYQNHRMELSLLLHDESIDYTYYTNELERYFNSLLPPKFGINFKDKDYSGLSAFYENWSDESLKLIEDVENLVGIDECDILTDAIRKATRALIDRQEKAGLLDAASSKRIKGMYEFYIPMQGYDEDTAGDVYEYMTAPNWTPNIQALVKKAKGRHTLAASPLSVLGNIAEKCMIQSCRNEAKQRLLTLAYNSGTTLLSTNYNYLVKFDGAWHRLSPEEGETGAEFEQRMLELALSGYEVISEKSKMRYHIDYIINDSQKNEHLVRVRRDGKTISVIVNGNPRAAQAINGLLGTKGDKGVVRNFLNTAMHSMAKCFTSMNPTFMFTNYSRDTLMAANNVYVKEGYQYFTKFIDNQVKGFRVRKLYKDYLEGKLNTNDYISSCFAEFIEHGGETGYVQIQSVDEWKDKLAKEINRGTRGGIVYKTKDAVKKLFETIEYCNRVIENNNRFAAYLTSRQMGRSIQRSVSDAKEVSVNFNRSGAGFNSGGVIGQAAGIMQEAYIFSNAAVQALANFGRNIKAAPKEVIVSAMVIPMTIGLMMPMVNAVLYAALSGGDGDDDDDDEYSKLPSWTRRNNLCFYCGQWVTIPLPQELRCFYGMGESFSQFLRGKVDPDKASADVLGSFLDLLPINLFGAESSFSALAPTAVKPFVQWELNEDYTGRPIRKESDFNKDKPEFTKCYAATSKWLVSLCEKANSLGTDELGLKGSEEVSSEYLDISPSFIEHMTRAFTGGLGQTFMDTFNAVGDAFEGKFVAKHIPVLKGAIKQIEDKDEEAYKVGADDNQQFFILRNNANKMLELYKTYKKSSGQSEDLDKFKEELENLIGNKEYQLYGLKDLGGKGIEENSVMSQIILYDKISRDIATIKSYMKLVNEDSQKYKELEDKMNLLNRMREERKRNAVETYRKNKSK